MAELKVYTDIYKNKIKVDFKYDPMLVSAVKEIPGAKFVGKEKGGPFWTVPLDLDTAKQLRLVFGEGLRVSKELKEWGWKIVKQVSQLAELSSADDAELSRLYHDAPYLAEHLYPFQRAGVVFTATSDHPLIADQPGLGKTRQAIGGIVEAGLPGPYLVIAPKTSLHTVWEHEIHDLLPDHAAIVIDGSRQHRLDMLEKADGEISAGEFPTWVIVNPEMVRFKKDDQGKYTVPGYPLIHDLEWSAVIVDECHRGAIRNPNTVTARAMYKLKATKRIALSGTPMKNRPVDLWGTLHWLNPDVFSSKWRWADRYLHVYHNGYGNVFCSGRTDSGTKCGRCEGGIRLESMDAFNEHLTPYLLRRTKAEVFPELPPKQHTDVWCEMVPKQAAQYKQFAELAEVVIRDETVSATNVLAELTRLKQFAISYQDVHYDDDDNFTLEPDIKHSGKMEALETLLEERGILDFDGSEKVVIFSQFKVVVNAIHRWLETKGVTALRITGDIKGKDRDEAQDLFQSEQGPRVMLMTTTAGGVAITLDRADSVIFMDETWSPADMEQAEDRLHRVSRIHHVTVYTLRTTDTVDHYIMDLVRTKGSIQDLVMDDRRKLQLK